MLFLQFVKKYTVILNLIIILGLVNWSIIAKESQLQNGKIVLIQLAPVDPRSLMQGDYMALRFGIAEKISTQLSKSELSKKQLEHNTNSDGFVLVKLNDQNIASFEAIYTNQVLSPKNLLLHYRVRNSNVQLASNAFFFQEGKATIFETARYGQFRVNDNGELLLANMLDKDLIILK